MSPLSLRSDTSKRAAPSYLGVTCLQSRLPTALDFLKQQSLLFDAFAIYDLRGLLPIHFEWDRGRVAQSAGPEAKELLAELTPQLEFLWWEGLVIDGELEMSRLTGKLDEEARQKFEADRQDTIRLHEDIHAQMKAKLLRDYESPDPVKRRFEKLKTARAKPDDPRHTFLLAADALMQLRYAARESYGPQLMAWNSLCTRLCAGVVSATSNWAAASLEQLPKPALAGASRTATLSDIYSIVLNKLPTPSPIVPWEEIVAFKKEPEQQKHLTALRAWISEMSRQQVSYQEACEKIEMLIGSYRGWLKASGMRYRDAVVRAVILGAMDVATLSPKKAVSRYFDVRKEKARLLEGELNAPGRELAYIVKTEQRAAQNRL